MTALQRFITLIILLLGINTLHAQSSDELVVWSEPSVEHLEGDRYQVVIAAQIAQGWKIYDLTEYESGPNPTKLTFSLPEGVELVGEVRSLEPAVVKWDDIFELNIGYYQDHVVFVQEMAVERGGSVELVVEYMMCNDESCMPPTDQIFSIYVGGEEALSGSQSDSESQSGSDFGSGSGSGLWLIILEAILWGFAALLTPCVFPMVPLTISFFMKDGSRGRFTAMLYGLFIVLLYTLPITVIILTTYLFGGDAVMTDIFNWIATHWLPNIIFFVVFMLFAASFFGAFEITLPSSWVNSSDSRADKGSIGGVLFLALTLVLVSFSCTGPIVGSVLIKSVSGDIWQPIITMFAFSVAFALPFVIVALFPTLLKRMPRSGGWLGSVKIVLGFLEIALGLKFLSVADQTYHWGLLSREIYLAIWIVVFSLLGLYLLGKIRFYDGDRVESIGVGRLSLSIVIFSFVVYLIPGMWGAPLPALAGYLPPPSSTESTMVVGFDRDDKDGSITQNNSPKFNAIEEAQAYANSVNKPLMVYFTGHGCVNCREMEQRVWSVPQVREIIDQNYVVVALYMDDKKELPESEWVTTISGRVLKSVGRVNSHIAMNRFGVNAQPYYILLGRDGEELVSPRGYDLNVDSYVNFLKQGVENYQNM